MSYESIVEESWRSNRTPLAEVIAREQERGLWGMS